MSAGGLPRRPIETAPQARTRFRNELIALEERTTDGLDLVVSQLDRALEAINYQDVELAGMVAAGDDKIDVLYLDIHDGVLAVLAVEPPNPEDLRLLAALLHSIRCIERMGDQCVNMAKLVPLSGYEAPKDHQILGLIEKMGISVRQQVVQAKDAFRMRHVSLARDLVRQDAEVNRLNRDIFQRAVEIGDDIEVREWAMFMILVARCLERIGDNTVDIAEQTAFVVSGLFREFHDAGESSF